MYRTRSILASAVAIALASQAFAVDLSLGSSKLTARRNAKIEQAGGAVQLKVDDPGWDSGLVVEPKGAASWDLSAAEFVAVDVENVSELQARLLMQVTAGGPETHDKKDYRETNAGIALNPGEKRTLRMRLPHRWKYAAPSGMPGMRAIDTSNIVRVEFFMQWPFERPTPGLLNVRLSNLRTEGTLVPTAPVTAEKYAPFIDTYGQFIHGDWPAKIHSQADLRKNFEKEKAELDASVRPAEWDRYGGWKTGPQLKATGSFRTEKHEGKWYLVDPDGRLFFSQGLDVLSTYNDPLKVMPGKEGWFASLPAGTTAYQPTEVALSQKYGTRNYAGAYFETLARRLEHWGMNSIGNWSRPELMALGKTPYTLQLTDYDWKMPRIAESKVKFYDVFDPAYAAKMKNLVSTAAAKDPMVTKSLTDPMCIGYFIDNELNFGNRGKLTLVDDILRSPAKQAAKRELAADMKAKYGEIAKLNAAWGTSHGDWDALLASTGVPASDEYRADSKAFFQKMVDRYFELARDAVKSVAPDRLYLGCRFISTDAVRPALAEASRKYCDVLSVNIYSASAANFPVEGMPDMPMLIGEFHFGVLDRGMFSASLCNAGVTQGDRATAYTRFMQGVLAHPNFVGAHWFQYRDQPLTGRGDGEAYPIGFVDIDDTPYEEICRAARDVGENMYRYRAAGKLTNEMSAAK